MYNKLKNQMPDYTKIKKSYTIKLPETFVISNVCNGNNH